jgi:uncharacterized protein YqeY
MKLQTKINEDLKQAMIEKNEDKKNILRQLKTSFQNAALNRGNVNVELDDTEVINIIRKAIAQRRDSITSFAIGGREDLVNKENDEIKLLEVYLPEELSSEELGNIVNASISEVGATTKKDMGKVIKLVVERVSGRVDNKTISMKVGEKLK